MHHGINGSLADDCVRIKDLGYNASSHIQMYGERFEIVSDPFPTGTQLQSSLQPPATRPNGRSIYRHRFS